MLWLVFTWCVCGKVGGVLVMPLNDNLVQIKRTCVDGWSSRNLLNVSFATLRVPTKEEASDLLKLGKVHDFSFWIVNSFIYFCFSFNYQDFHGSDFNCLSQSEF